MNPCPKLFLLLSLLSLGACRTPQIDVWPSRMNTALAERTAPMSADERADYEAGFRDGASMVHEALKAGVRPYRPVMDHPSAAPRWRGPAPEGVQVETVTPVPDIDAETGLLLHPASDVKGQAFARGQVQGFTWALSAIGQTLVRPIPDLHLPTQWEPFSTPLDGQDLDGGDKAIRLLWAPGHLAWSWKERGFPGRRTWRIWEDEAAPAWIGASVEAIWVEPKGGPALALDLESGGILAVRPAVPHDPSRSTPLQRYEEGILNEYKAPAFQEKLATLRKTADSGAATDLLAVAHHLSGMGDQADREAFTWYLKAAEKGSPEGMLQAGTLLFHGKSVAPDKEAARTWLERAVKAGQPEAKDVLDLLFEGAQ